VCVSRVEIHDIVPISTGTLLCVCVPYTWMRVGVCMHVCACVRACVSCSIFLGLALSLALYVLGHEAAPKGDHGGVCNHRAIACF